MPKLILSDSEVGMIKGLMDHTKFNDQQILSIFSYLDRNINHREIGAIRKRSKKRYNEIPAVSEVAIKSLLYDYQKIVGLAERLGFCPSTEENSKISKAVEIMKTAVTVFNNCTIEARSETFVVLAMVAWTYILYAKLRIPGIEPAYLDELPQPALDVTRARLWDVRKCISDVKCELTKGQIANLNYLVEVRDRVVHRSADDLNDEIQGKAQACVLNFLDFVKANFGERFDFSNDLAFAIQLHRLAIDAPNALKGIAPVSKSIAAVNALLEGDMSADDYNDPQYSYRVYVVPKVTNNPRGADQTVSYSPVGSSVEMAIKQVERPKLRATEAMRYLVENGFPDLTRQRFIDAWRKHDLKNPKKTYGVELGGQWFWYQEGIAKIASVLSSKI